MTISLWACGRKHLSQHQGSIFSLSLETDSLEMMMTNLTCSTIQGRGLRPRVIVAHYQLPKPSLSKKLPAMSLAMYI